MSRRDRQPPDRSGATVTAPEGDRPPWVADPVVGLRVRNTLTEYELPLWRTETTVGRDPRCDIVIESDAVSAVHCAIERGGGGACVVHDRGSKNGILTDGGHRRVFDLPAGSLFMVGNCPLVAFSASMQQVRTQLQRYLGYDERHQQGVENALEAAGQRRHVMLVEPPGGQADRVARLLHAAGPGARQPLQVADRIPASRTAQGALVRAAKHGTLVVRVDDAPEDLTALSEQAALHNVRVMVIGPRADGSLLELLVDGAPGRRPVLVRIPPVAERPEPDRMRLLSIVTEEIGRRLGVAEIGVDAYPGLLHHDWPDNLDELDQAIEWLLVVRQQGSQRKAAAALGLKWGAFNRWIRKFLPLG
jgi:hypothetical protein